MANIKWSYMDHWMTDTAQGHVSPYVSRQCMDRYIKQITALGFQGFDSFAMRLGAWSAMFGSPRQFLTYLQDMGLEKIVGLFWDYPYASSTRAPHIRSTHEAIVGDVAGIMKQCNGLGVEKLVILPSCTDWQVEPVTDDKIKIMADLWNRVGMLTKENGIQTTCHHEFWGAIRTPEQLDKFYSWTDPQYVTYWCDTAQTVIAGNDPVKLYSKYHDRMGGFHFKDTQNIDTKGEYKIPPDPEVQAPFHERWFWEMGTPEGLVDFPALMKALKEQNYRGWLTVEHDKVDFAGGNYAECTCIARWYIDNVLSKIYS